jgi:hypothetical protein
VAGSESGVDAGGAVVMVGVGVFAGGRGDEVLGGGAAPCPAPGVKYDAVKNRNGEVANTKTADCGVILAFRGNGVGCPFKEVHSERSDDQPC